MLEGQRKPAREAYYGLCGHMSGSSSVFTNRTVNWETRGRGRSRPQEQRHKRWNGCAGLNVQCERQDKTLHRKATGKIITAGNTQFHLFFFYESSHFIHISLVFTYCPHFCVSGSHPGHPVTFSHQVSLGFSWLRQFLRVSSFVCLFVCFNNMYLFIWLYWILTAACRI